MKRDFSIKSDDWNERFVPNHHIVLKDSKT